MIEAMLMAEPFCSTRVGDACFKHGAAKLISVAVPNTDQHSTPSAPMCYGFQPHGVVFSLGEKSN
jgi:hypothetical protein